MQPTPRKKIKLSKISAMHYFKLVFRSLLFLSVLGMYIYKRVMGNGELFRDSEHLPLVLWLIWLLFVVEMGLRFMPSPMESMGCQKQFSRNYRPTGRDGKLDSWKSTLAVTVAWLLLNGAIGALYFVHVIDQGILMLVALAYSVCDMICILFFCPFQTWFMKNKCCGSCRIYNWDYAMMFTPLVFIPHVYSWSLLGIALVLLFSWELAVRRHPERFLEKTNASLACANCQEKLCQHKRQLRHFLRQNRQLFSSLEVLRKEPLKGEES